MKNRNVGRRRIDRYIMAAIDPINKAKTPAEKIEAVVGYLELLNKYRGEFKVGCVIPLTGDKNNREIYDRRADMIDIKGLAHRFILSVIEGE